MTKLAIALELPGEISRPIHCVGVVVRRDSDWTAIYFSELKPEDRRRIAEFVLQSMLGVPP